MFQTYDEKTRNNEPKSINGVETMWKKSKEVMDGCGDTRPKEVWHSELARESTQGDKQCQWHLKLLKIYDTREEEYIYMCMCMCIQKLSQILL